jgi:MFS superfamily sulfate permease-like transporter
MMRHGEERGAVREGNMTLRYWREDLGAAIAVFLLAIPLSIGVAILAGVPYEKAAGVGLLSSVVGGVVSLFSGSPLQITGPSNGAAVLYLTIKDELGAGAAALAVAAGGLMQAAAGALRLGPLFRTASPALIQGMLGGVGLLIISSQSYLMLDAVPPGAGKEFGGVLNLLGLPDALVASFTQRDRLPPALLGAGSLATMLLWDRYGGVARKRAPAALIGVLSGFFLNALVELDPRRFVAPERLLDVVSIPSAAVLSYAWHASFWVAAASFAFVGSIKSLLSARAIDQMDHAGPRADYSRELVAQGVGNVACGLLGLLPLAGIVIRSSTNVASGARTRLAGALQGAFTLILLLCLPQVLPLIPTASLSAALVHAGARLVDFGIPTRLWQQDRFEVCVYLITKMLVFATDMLTGIAVGVALSLSRFAMSRASSS